MPENPPRNASNPRSPSARRLRLQAAERTRARVAWWQQTARRVAFAALAVGLVGALGEGVARVGEPLLVPPDSTIPEPRPGRQTEFSGEAGRAQEAMRGIPMVSDPLTGWALPANRAFSADGTQIRVNSLGLRGPELAPRAPNEVRLLSLGDSTIFGDGVTEVEVFSTVAAQVLATRWGVPVSGVIGGVPGHDSSQSLARLSEKGAAIEPSWVLVGNLWSDVYKDNGQTRLTPAVEEMRGPLARLATYRILRSLLAPMLIQRKVGWIASMETDVGGTGSGARARVLLKNYIDNLREIAAATYRLGARPLFIALPAPIDLDPAGPPSDVLEYRVAMKTVASETDAPFVDGPLWFREHEATIGFFDDQVHPNRYGHALLGLAVADAIATAAPASPSP